MAASVASTVAEWKVSYSGTWNLNVDTDIVRKMTF